MRINPSEKYIDNIANRKQRTEEITRIVALVLVYVSTFFFFIKLLFL